MASNPEEAFLFSVLAQNFEGDIDVSQKTLLSGSVDGSYLKIKPKAVIYPKTKEDFGKIFAFAKNYRLPISVRGKGMSTSGGSLTEGVQIDMSRYFSKVERVDIKNNLATILAGTDIETVVDRFKHVGVFCPILSSEVQGNTLGGLVALNARTSASISHGNMRLWVEGLKVILDDGNEYTIEEGVQLTGRLLEIYTNLSTYIEQESQNINASANRHIDTTTGYNIWNRSIGQRQLLDIIVGSEGTLCIITSILLRVIPLPQHAYTLSCGIQTLADLEQAKAIYQASGVDSLSVFDKTIISLSTLDEQKNLPAHIKKSNSRLILSGTFYKKQNELAHHAVKSCGDKLSTISKEIFVESGILCVKQEHAFRRYTIAAHLARVRDFSYITTLDGIAITEQENKKVADELDMLLTSSGYTYLLGTNASLSMSSFLFFADTRTRQGRKDLDFCLARAARIIQIHKGAITCGNGDGIIRTPYMRISSEQHMLNVFSYIQRLFDPEQVLNSGKKTFITNASIEHYLRESALG